MRSACSIARSPPRSPGNCRGRRRGCLLFAGAADDVGTSTVLLNLAVTLARQEATVTVVDAHLARPALADRLGLPPAPGLREVLAGQMPRGVVPAGNGAAEPVSCCRPALLGQPTGRLRCDAIVEIAPRSQRLRPDRRRPVGPNANAGGRLCQRKRRGLPGHAAGFGAAGDRRPSGRNPDRRPAGSAAAC